MAHDFPTDPVEKEVKQEIEQVTGDAKQGARRLPLFRVGSPPVAHGAVRGILNPTAAPRVALVPLIGADGAGKTSLHRALADHVAGREGLPSPPLRLVQVGDASATVLDARMPWGYLQLVDFPSAQVEEMMLGAAPAAAALLVVSVLDSVMPGTVRSLQHVRELGVPRVAVALTQCDAIDDAEMLDLVTMEILEQLSKHGYPGDGTPVVPVSARAPQGGGHERAMVSVAELFEAIVNLLR